MKSYKVHKIVYNPQEEWQIFENTQERTHSSHLQDTFTAVHDRQFVLTFQLFSELLIVHTVAFRLTSVCGGIETVDSFFTQAL